MTNSTRDESDGVNDDREPTDEELFIVHSRMLVALFAATVLIALFISLPLLVAYVRDQPPPFPILLLVLFAGAVGAFVSALQRSHSFKEISPILLRGHRKARTNWFLYAYALIPPLIGAVAAIVIYVFFQSRVLTSPIFPVFDCKLEPPHGPDGCSAFEQFFDFGPKGMVDYAKVLLWAFVAGFSERFVPDLVAKLARKFDET